jgi:hypothetical protein
MKKVFLIAGVAIIGTGVAMHTVGHEPKCPLGIIKSQQKAQKPKAEAAVATHDEVHYLHK